MPGPSYEVPETITEGSQIYLNCEVGEAVGPDNDLHERVLDRFEIAFSDSFLQLYYRYPDTGPGENTRIDIVLLNPVVGVVAANIFEFEIEDLEDISGPDWRVESLQQTIRPPTAIRDAVVGIRRQFTDRDELRDREYNPLVPISGYVALPNIQREEWEHRFEDVETDQLLFVEDLGGRDSQGSDPLFNRLTDADEEELDEQLLRNGLAVLKFSGRISGGQLNVAEEPSTKRDLLDFIQERLKILTDKQLKIGLQAPDAPQQIRGIAGSGKTVVTALRAAKLHWEHEDWDIAVTFRNHGLRQTHKEYIEAFYSGFSDGESPDWNKLQVLHDWGGKTVGPGMYYVVSNAADQDPLTFTEAQARWGRLSSGTHLLDRCCHGLVQSESIPPIFDAILIDEAQDLPEFYFRMCHQATKEPKRVYWAYDEAQNLATLESKSAKELFGTDADGNAIVDVSGRLENGVNATHVMRKAFRTPRSVLMTAHAFGMGLYRDGVVVQTITNARGWDRLGYEIVSGNFENAGNEVVLRRPSKNSPHPLREFQSPNELIRIEWTESWEDEVDWVVEDIQREIANENVVPNEIMVTYLWTGRGRQEKVDQLISKLSEDISDLQSVESTGVFDVSEAVSRMGEDAPFRKPGRVSVSGVHYARGNEAPIVYVMGMDAVAESTSKEITKDREESWRRAHIKARNRAFVSFTRTQGWLVATGTDPSNRIAGELNAVLLDTREDNPEISLEVPPDDSPFKDLEPRSVADEFQTAMDEFQTD